MDQVRHRRSRNPSLLQKLLVRRADGKAKQAELWAEDESVFHQRLEYLELSADTTRSTIALAFSADGRFFASTHGDHTVKITDFSRSKVVQTLRGHPRTPWTVKFHPKDSRIVASGCLASEVRVWNMSTGQCLHVAKLKAAIISITFHPSGNVLAIASGQCVYLWNFNNKPCPRKEWRHAHTLRCVRFTPDGAGLIVGAANKGPTDQSHISVEVTGAAVAQEVQAEVTFRLQVWDFNLEAVLTDSRDPVMTRPRKLLEKTLLYNDGGFDLSPDGLWLCAIAKLNKVAGDPPLAVWSSATVSVAAMRYGVDSTVAVKPPSSALSECVKRGVAPRHGMQLASIAALEVKRGGAELPVPAARRIERAGDAGERRGKRAKDGGGPLAPWPTRDPSKCWFGGFSNLGKCAGAGGGEALFAASGQGMVAQAGGREAPPHMPSPRIKLKRRRSGSSMSTGGGSTGDRSSGFGLSWDSESQKTPVSKPINSYPRERRRARLGDKESSNGAEPVPSRPEIPGEGERGEEKMLSFAKEQGSLGANRCVAQHTQQEERRPPPLPSPLPMINGKVASSPHVSTSTAAPTPSRPFSAPSALSGELGISLPLLIPPPAASTFAQPHEAVVDHPVLNLQPTVAEAPGETSQQHRRPEEESQLFFLQSPPDPEGGAVGGSPEASAGEEGGGTIRGSIGGGVADGGERENRSGRRVGKRGGASCCLRRESRPAPPWQVQSSSEDLVPHLVLVSLHPGPEEGGREGSRVIRAAAMEAVAAKQVTSVKLSPSMRYILLGAGARVGQSGSQQSLRPTQEGSASNGIGRASNPEHTVTSIYRASDLLPANFMPTVDDDVNIACFHPEPGMGCVYGTKQGRVCLVRVADR